MQACTSTILAWRIPWTKEPGRLQSMGSQRVGHSRVTKSYFFLLRVTFFFVTFFLLLFQFLSNPWNTESSNPQFSISNTFFYFKKKDYGTCTNTNIFFFKC